MNAATDSVDSDEYVREQLSDADREILQVLADRGGPLSERAERALEFLDEMDGGQE